MVIEAAASPAGMLESAVWLAGSLLCQRQVPLPVEVAAGVGRAAAARAGGRGADGGGGPPPGRGAAGRRRASALLAGVLDRLPPGGTVEVVLSATGSALSLPVELIRLATGTRR